MAKNGIERVMERCSARFGRCKLTIQQLLERFTTDRVMFQKLDLCVVHVAKNQHGDTEISFSTSIKPSPFLEPKAPVGVILWVPREEWDLLVREWEASASAPRNEEPNPKAEGQPHV